MHVDDIEEIFNQANELIREAIKVEDHSQVSLVFDSDELSAEIASALSNDFKRVAVNTQHAIYRGLNLARAVGILAHEYGHVDYNKRKGILRWNGKTPKPEEELSCDRYAGVILGRLKLSFSEYVESIRSLHKDGLRDSRYPTFADSAFAIQEGWEEQK